MANPPDFDRQGRVLTIDEIINPKRSRSNGGGGATNINSIAVLSPSSVAAAPAGNSTTQTKTNLDIVNPNFLRLNHGQVIYTPGRENDSPMGGGGVGGARNKNVSFGGGSHHSTTSTVNSARCGHI